MLFVLNELIMLGFLKIRMGLLNIDCVFEIGSATT